jgi:aryl-alcohol dehydrogenase-like predicted oxidoreductase
MEYIRFGSTAMKVSRICLGCMGFGDAERWIHKWVLNEDKSVPDDHLSSPHDDMVSENALLGRHF